MTDFYDRGFREGHGNSGRFDDSEPIQNYADKYDYEKGIEDGMRRRGYSSDNTGSREE